MLFRKLSLSILFSYAVMCPSLYAQESSPKIIFGEIETNATSSAAAVRAYLSKIMTSGNPVSLGEVAFTEKKTSLLGTHYAFRQQLNGIPIEDADIRISVNETNKKIYRVYNNAVNHFKISMFDKSATLSEDKAYDIAWNDLKVSGPLMSKPAIKLVYQREKSELKLFYKVNLAPAEPFGYWEYTIHAVTGKIKDKRDIRLTRYAKDTKKTAIVKSNKRLLNRQQEFLRFSSLQLDEENEQAQADGTALVFDPDPRTALSNEQLEDGSPAEAFEGAYVDRVLKDLKVVNGKYTLQGPFIHIKDFEAPMVAPTTSENGSWSFKRGNNGFNDAMTYFHIDQNQRYMQSLGFVGAKGIQNGPISVDSNGLGGDDNSHFIPGQNRIAFGHGCVDDNEDADVILHEYGHAIQDSINSSWRGGDTGAMGEGFGDYWATSYSYSTPNGQTFTPDRVFQWDGGGNCWPGRSVNVEHARYDHNRSYHAHQSVNGYVSDELWSTPLVQSLKELLSMGQRRENVDQIVLEAHFGLGANLKMRDMANSIIQVAKRLHPNGPYASVFTKHFVKHNILEAPKPRIEIASVTVENAGANHVLDPGETVDLVITLKNTGTAAAHAVRGLLSSNNPRVRLSSQEIFLGNLDIGAQSDSGHVKLTLAKDAICGDFVNLVLEVRYEDEMFGAERLAIEIPVGIANIASGRVLLDPPLQIPDNTPEGIESAIWLDDKGTIKDSNSVEVSINLEHSYLSDLTVTLVSPSGKEVMLHNKRGSGRNLVGTYPTTLTPSESFSRLKGESLQGQWTLKAVDDVSQDSGILKEWGFKVTMGHQCN